MGFTVVSIGRNTWTVITAVGGIDTGITRFSFEMQQQVGREFNGHLVDWGGSMCNGRVTFYQQIPSSARPYRSGQVSLSRSWC